MNGENWRDIPGYEGLYQVSDLGRVRSIDRVTYGAGGKYRLFKGRVLKSCLNSKGYHQCVFSVNGIRHFVMVHQLVAMAFLNHKPDGYNLVVDHINNIPTDNRLTNLQVVSHRYNTSKDRKGSSRYTGVGWREKKKRWAAYIAINGKLNHLGLFIDESEAALAYQNALAKLQENETVHRLGSR